MRFLYMQLCVKNYIHAYLTFKNIYIICSSNSHTTRCSCFNSILYSHEYQMHTYFATWSRFYRNIKVRKKQQHQQRWEFRLVKVRKNVTVVKSSTLSWAHLKPHKCVFSRLYILFSSFSFSSTLAAHTRLQYKTYRLNWLDQKIKWPQKSRMFTEF